MAFKVKSRIIAGLACAGAVAAVFLTAACSSAPAAAAPNSPAATTQPAAAPAATTPTPTVASAPNVRLRQGAIGTITAIGTDNTLVLTTMQGQQAVVQVGANTVIEKTITATAADLQTGEFLTIAGDPDASGAIAATSILSSRQLQNMAFPSAPSGVTPSPGAIFRQRTGNGTPTGTGGGTVFGGGNGAGVFSRIFGNLKTVDGSTLTITTLQGEELKVNIGPNTVIEKTVAGAPSDLEEGQLVTVVGPTDASGVVTAESISIRPAGSNFPIVVPGPN